MNLEWGGGRGWGLGWGRGGWGEVSLLFIRVQYPVIRSHANSCGQGVPQRIHSDDVKATNTLSDMVSDDNKSNTSQWSVFDCLSIRNRVDCKRSGKKRSKTHKRLKQRFLIGRNRTERAHFRGSPLFQATYTIKTEKQTINSTYLGRE